MTKHFRIEAVSDYRWMFGQRVQTLTGVRDARTFIGRQGIPRYAGSSALTNNRAIPVLLFIYPSSHFTAITVDTITTSINLDDEIRHWLNLAPFIHTYTMSVVAHNSKRSLTEADPNAENAPQKRTSARVSAKTHGKENAATETAEAKGKEMRRLQPPRNQSRSRNPREERNLRC